MTVVNVLIVVGVVVAILTLGLALAAAVIMAFMALAKVPRLARLAKAAGDWFSALILPPLVVPLMLAALGPLLVGLLFLSVGIYLIVAGSGAGDGGQVFGGVIVCLLGLFSAWTGPYRVSAQCSGRQVRFWVVGSAFLTGGGVAIVVSQGYFAISEAGGCSSNISGLFAGAGVGFIGMGFLMQALEGTLERFPSGVPGSEVAGLRQKAIRHSVVAAGLVGVLVTFGGLAIAGTITCAPSIAVMWICFFGVLVLIVQLGHIKREALRVARKQ